MCGEHRLPFVRQLPEMLAGPDRASTRAEKGPPSGLLPPMVVCLTQLRRSVLVHEPAAHPDLEPLPRRAAARRPPGSPTASPGPRSVPGLSSRWLSVLSAAEEGSAVLAHAQREARSPGCQGPCLPRERIGELPWTSVPASCDLIASLPNSTRTAVSGNSPNTIRHMRKTSLNGRIQGKLYLPYDQAVNGTKPKFAVTQNPHK